MKIDDLRKSDNVEDRRSSSGGSFSSGGSGLPILQLLWITDSSTFIDARELENQACGFNHLTATWRRGTNQHF